MSQPSPPLASPDEIEQQFYEALQQGDIERLMGVWSEDEDVACVHPGGPRLVGHGAIRASFEALFANGPVGAQPARVRRVLNHACAVHHVLEHVQGMTEDGPQQGWVLATNVYVKTTQGWRLVVHHASPGSPNDVQEISEAPAVLH